MDTNKIRKKREKEDEEKEEAEEEEVQAGYTRRKFEENENYSE